MNARVTGILGLAAARSPGAIVKTTAVDWEVITPDAAPADAVTSASVCTVMPVPLPAFGAPIVKPLRVMVKVVPAAIPATAVEITIEVAPGAAEVAVIVRTDVVPAVLTEGVADVAKNPSG